MHELSIVETLIEQVDKEVARSGHQGRIVRLELVIGRLSGVCVDSIRFAFELLSAETPLEGSQIDIREPRASCRCRACGASCEIEEIVAACPQCGSGDIVIEGGQDLLLQSIELEA